MYPRLVGETRTHPLLPKRGPPHVTAAPQTRLLPTAVLAGVTWSLKAAPGQPTSLWASCLCLPATSNEVPEGTPCRRGVPGARGSGGLLYLHSASGSGGAFPGQGAGSGSRAVGLRLFLFGEPKLEVLEWSTGPAGHPSLMCPSPQRSMWAQPVDDATWEGGALRICHPLRRGVTAVLSSGRAGPGVFELPPEQGRAT